MSENSYNSDWDVYFCYLEDMPAFISVDLGVAEAAPIHEKPALLEIMVGLQTIEENGFPEEREWSVLEKIEDNLVNTLEKKLDAVFVAKTLNNGKRGFYFYTGETLLLEQTMEAIIAEFPDYNIEYQETEDEEWKVYSDYLYPDEDSLQKIYNNRVLLQLEEQGDQPFVPRIITHLVYFASEADRAAFADIITKEGFVIDAQEKVEARAEKHYKLVFSKEDLAEEETINEVTLMLRHLAEKYNGEYDGWETAIIREND